MAAKQALGRGLKALIPDTPRARTGLTRVAVDQLVPNPEQPRHRFDDQALAELAASLVRHGVLQPLLVSEDGPNRYVIITGERRWRAAKQAGLETVPAVIRERLDGAEQLELALVENLQRRDLTPLEEARAFEHLRLNLGLSQADIAERVGMDRSTVANALRLLKLPGPVQELVDNGALSAGHARALLGLSDDDARCQRAREAVASGQSVRDLERAVAEAKEPTEPPEARTRGRAATPRDPNLVAAERKLGVRLGAPVEIRSRRRGGSIVIRCGDHDELMRVFDLLMGGS